jgi:dTDP-4-amino-4,6-dideoxygalactose transaminase
MIPRYDPTFQYKDLLKAFRQSSLSDPDEILRAELKNLYNVKHVFTFDSARIALFTLLKAYNRPGGVLMPAYTCIVVPEAVDCAGYQPVFADIDLCTLNVNTETLTKALTPDVTVIMPTHLFGISCDLDEVVAFGRKHNLLVVEDAAPAVGAEYHGKNVGLFGDAAIISFQATKVISSEDGGALLTNNDELAEKIKPLLLEGLSPTNRWLLLVKAILRKLVLNPRIYPLVQFAYRAVRRELMYEVVPPQVGDPDAYLKLCSPFTSALVSLQIDRLEWNLERRRKLAQIYKEKLEGHPDIKLTLNVENSAPAWIQFPIRVKDKGHFYRYMQRYGIDMSWTYKYSCADSYEREGFPMANTAAKTVLGLPTYPSLTDDQARYISSIASRYSENVRL